MNSKKAKTLTFCLGVVLVLGLISCKDKNPPVGIVPVSEPITLSPTPTPRCQLNGTLTTTPVPSPDELGMTCFNPSLPDYGYYEHAGGATILGRAYTNFPGITLTMAIYDGADNLLDCGILMSDLNGYISKSFVVQGSENVSQPWHVVVCYPENQLPVVFNASNPDYLDVEPVTVMPSAPTPTATPPCMNMPILCVDKKYGMEKYSGYKLSDCTALFFINRWCTEEAKVAYYDGNDDLVYVDQKPCAYHPENYPDDWSSCVESYYVLNGTEAPGTWHMVLYKTAETPSATYSGAGGIIMCPPIAFEVE